MDIMETFGGLMTTYEILSGVGGILQIVLIIIRRANNPLIALGMILDAIGLSGMSFGYFLTGESLYGILSIFGFILDIVFVVHIIYRDEHPKKQKGSGSKNSKDTTIQKIIQFFKKPKN